MLCVGRLFGMACVKCHGIFLERHRLLCTTRASHLCSIVRLMIGGICRSLRYMRLLLWCRHLLGVLIVRGSIVFYTAIDFEWKKYKLSALRSILTNLLFAISDCRNFLRIMSRCDASHRRHIGHIGCARHFSSNDWHRQQRSIKQRFQFSVGTINPCPSFRSDFSYQSLTTKIGISIESIFEEKRGRDVPVTQFLSPSTPCGSDNYSTWPHAFAIPIHKPKNRDDFSTLAATLPVYVCRPYPVDSVSIPPTEINPEKEEEKRILFQSPIPFGDAWIVRK